MRKSGVQSRAAGSGVSVYERFVSTAHRTYKLALSPLIGGQCRFLPSCSDYAAEALITHGALRGGWLAARRLCRCNPWGGAGYDPPPQRAPRFEEARTWTCEP